MEQLCPTRVELAKLRRLLNTEKQWRVIVNLGPNFQQTVRLETCLQVLTVDDTINQQVSSVFNHQTTGAKIQISDKIKSCDKWSFGTKIQFTKKGNFKV